MQTQINAYNALFLLDPNVSLQNKVRLLSVRRTFNLLVINTTKQFSPNDIRGVTCEIPSTRCTLSGQGFQLQGCSSGETLAPAQLGSNRFLCPNLKEIKRKSKWLARDIYLGSSVPLFQFNFYPISELSNIFLKTHLLTFLLSSLKM